MAEPGLAVLICLILAKSSMSQDTSPETPSFVPLGLVVGKPTSAVLNSNQPLEISIQGPLDQTHEVIKIMDIQSFEMEYLVFRC